MQLREFSDGFTRLADDLQSMCSSKQDRLLEPEERRSIAKLNNENKMRKDAGAWETFWQL